MEEGFVMLRSAFKKAGIDDEQMKCILHINYHYFLLSYTFSSSMPVVFGRTVIFDITSSKQAMVH